MQLRQHRKDRNSQITRNSNLWAKRSPCKKKLFIDKPRNLSSAEERLTALSQRAFLQNLQQVHLIIHEEFFDSKFLSDASAVLPAACEVSFNENLPHKNRPENSTQRLYRVNHQVCNYILVLCQWGVTRKESPRYYSFPCLCTYCLTNQMPALNMLLGPLCSRAGRAWCLFWFYPRQSQWDGATRSKTHSGHWVNYHIQWRHLIGQAVGEEGRREWVDPKKTLCAHCSSTYIMFSFFFLKVTFITLLVLSQLYKSVKYRVTSFRMFRYSDVCFARRRLSLVIM